MATVQTLLGAVRRRLWRGQFVAAVRLALWGSAGLMLLAAAVHLGARPVPVGAVLGVLAVLWTSMLVGAGLRRPTDPVCALWADRHLGGASAFTTLLEVGHGRPALSNAQAVRWLEDWAMARVPDSLRRLAERHETARLSRPLATMLVCTALASFVLALPDLAPSARRLGAASAPPGAADGPTPNAGSPAAEEPVGDITAALRSTKSSDAPQRRAAGRAPAAGPSKADDGTGFAATPPGAVPPGETATARESLAGTAVNVGRSAGTGQAAGSGAGRDAGDGRDDRADAPGSRVARGTMPVRRVETAARRAPAPSQADMDRSASYDDGVSKPGAAARQAGAAAAAATPPAVTPATSLTATETNYVQAWLRATERRR